VGCLLNFYSAVILDCCAGEHGLKNSFLGQVLEKQAALDLYYNLLS
jgi:hypothetical protein